MARKMRGKGLGGGDMYSLPKPSFPKPGTFGNPKPRPMKPPGAGAGPRGIVPQSYKDAHQAEWDAANHKERMAMRKAAPRVKPGTSVSRPRKPRKGGSSIKPPSGGLGKY